MIRHAALALALVGCAKAQSDPADARTIPLVTNPNVIQREEADDYVVKGRTLAEVSQEISRHGPTSQGKKYAGMHSSRFRYSYTSQMRAGKCSPRPTVELYSVTTRPRWADSASAEADAQAAWGSYIKALRIHEENHRRIAFKYASNLHRRLSELGTSTCAELGREVTKLVNANSANSQKEQEAYDARTRHGLTEGATFRRVTTAVRPPTELK
jgi:predicted secreted Zn-dependent protease